METVLKTAGNLLPYHLLSYGALLGTELFQVRHYPPVLNGSSSPRNTVATQLTLSTQSFVNTKICFHVLPMREFLALQKRIFPVYFGCQIGLAALTAVTRPPYSIVSLAQDGWSAAPLIIVLVTGTLNWFVYGPQTTTASFVRRALHGWISSCAEETHY